MTSTKHIWGAIVVVAVITAAPAAARAQGAVGGSQTTVLYPQPYPMSSATIGESHLHGMSNLVRSAGTANLMHSEAAKNYEQSRAMYFDNRLKLTQTYFDNKQLNYDYRQAQRGQRPTTEQLFRIAHQRAPEPLSPSELDPYSGEISWPVILMAPEYTDYRVAVDDLIRKRTTDALSVTTEEYAALRAVLDSMAAQLKANIAAYSPNDYTTAKGFLQSLATTTGVGAIY